MLPDEPPLHPYKRFEGRAYSAPPRGTAPLGRYLWGKKLSPLAAGRLVWRPLSLVALRKYVIRRQKCDSIDMREQVTRYIYQIFQRRGTSEHALMICFNFSLQPHLPLGTAEKLNSPDFPIPVSFIYGSDDWTRVVDQDFGKEIVANNKQAGQCKFSLCPDSDHNMHMDNPQALANLILNTLLDMDLPVLTLEEQAKALQDNDKSKDRKIGPRSESLAMMSKILENERDGIDYEKEVAENAGEEDEENPVPV